MSDQRQIVYDPEKGEVRAPDFTIAAAGQTGEDGQILHIYRYEDRRSKFYFIVERLKAVGPRFNCTVVDTGVCEIQYLGYDRDYEPGYQRNKDITKSQKRTALPNIAAGMALMEIRTFGKPLEVRIRSNLL